ncbi:MAG: spore germination protein GerPC [Tepidibacillus sp.]
MHDNSDLYEYVQHLYSHVKGQNDRINQLNALLLQLQEQMEVIKKDRQINIEKIEYKFDQLKIETLEGTLNIGLTPNGSGMFEELAVNQQVAEDVKVYSTKQADLFTQIQESVLQYLNHDVFKDINQIEQKYFRTVESEQQRQMVIEDIKKQIDERIHLYLNQYKNWDKENEQEIEKNIVQQIISDIKQAIEYFIQNLPQKENK